MPEGAPHGRFTGQVVVVTGAAAGIGAAISARFAAEGALVLMVDRDAEFADAPLPQNAAAMVQDITAHDAGKALVATAIARFGRIDVLVNNAGIGGSRSLAESDDALLHRLIDTNLTAMMRVTRDVVPHLAPTGSIVNISSVFGLAGYPGTAGYAVAKAGVAQFTRLLAAELGPKGIRANAVAPGVIATAMTEAHLRNPAYRRAMLAQTPLGRAAQPEEIAGIVAFLASADASFVTGQVIAADGGWLVARHPLHEEPDA